MFDINKIKEPESLNEALIELNNNPDFKIICGGTDVLIKLHHGKISNINLLSIKKINQLRGINILDDKTISIGAATTFSDIFRNKIINDYIPILSEAAVSMGGPQIRNVATLGGNICNGAVSADSAPALLALNAKIKIKSLTSERVIKISDFYEGPGKVNIKNNELLTEILIEKNDYLNKIGKYIKFSNRKALDISLLGVAVLYERNERVFKDLRIALGVAAPTPIRCKNAESYAIGQIVCDETVNKIAQLAMTDANSRNSWRGSKDYRLHLINILVKRILNSTVIRSEIK